MPSFTDALIHHVPVIERVLSIFLWQVREIVMWQDNDNDSLLALAVESGCADVFNAVMACVDQELDSSEVRNVNVWRLW